MQFTSVASSSAGCCYILRSGDQPPLLIEAGIKPALIRRATDFQVSSFGACLVSHSHKDHSASGEFVMRCSVPVLATAPTIAAMKWNHPLCTPFEQVQTSNNEPTYRDTVVAGWRIRPFHVDHDCDGTVGFLIADSNGNKLVYITDAGFVRYAFTGLTHIAIECNHDDNEIINAMKLNEVNAVRYSRTRHTHMSIAAVQDFLSYHASKGLLQLLKEVHLLHLSDQFSVPAEFLSKVRRITGVPTYIANKKLS